MLLVCCWYVAVIILGEYILDLGAQDAGPNHQDVFSHLWDQKFGIQGCWVGTTPLKSKRSPRKNDAWKGLNWGIITRNNHIIIMRIVKMITMISSGRIMIMKQL